MTRAAFGPNESYVKPEWVTNYSGIGFAAFGTLALIFFVLLLVKLWSPAFRYFWVARERA